MKRIELTKEEADTIRDVLIAARVDIWQTARVSEGNLTGRDPAFPGDEPVCRTSPLLVAREGIDESYAVIERLSAAISVLHAVRERAGQP